MWDDELARVAQKWSDQCADVDYKGDFKRQDPTLFHDPHPQRKVGQYFKILTPIRTDYFNGKIFLHSCTFSLFSIKNLAPSTFELFQL